MMGSPTDNARGHGSGVNLSPTSGDGAGSGGRLARRARSFKDDLLERLTHVKTASSPTGDHNFPVMSASGSMKKPATASPALVAAAAAGAGFRPPQHQTPPGRPRNSRSRHGSTSRRDGRSTPTKDTLRKTSQKILKHFQDSVTSGIGSLSRNASTSASKEDVKAWTMSPPRSPNPAEIGNLQRKLSGALRYLKDAEEKGAWEQVPGAASVVLDTVYHILALVGDKLPNHQSAAIAVARNRVNVTVGELIKWSDDILLAHTECAAAASSIVAEVDVDLCAAAGARMPSLDSPAGEGWASSGQSSRTPSFSACVQPSLDSGCLVDALQDAVKCLVDTVEEKLAARDSSVSVDSSSDFDLDETRSDSSTRRSKLGAVKCSASVDWGESANKLSVPTEIVQRKSLPEIVMKTDVVVGSGGHHHHHHHHHHHNLHHRLHHQRPPTPPKRPPAPPMPEKSKLVHSHSSDSILDAGGRPVSGSLPYMTPPPPPPKPPPLSKDVLDSSLDSCVAPPLPPKRRQILNTIGGSPANPFSSSSLAYSAGNGQPPPLPPPRRTDIGGDPQAMLWRHERHSSSGEWKAASPSQAGPSSGGFFSGSGHQHHSHTPPPYLTSFDSTGSSSLVKARSCSWRRVSSGGNVSQSSSQSPLDDSMSACSGDSAFSTPMFSNRSFGDDERHMRSPTAALSASCDPFENLHAIAQELHQLSEMSVNPASTSTPKERRNLLGPPSAQGSNMAFVAMSASSSSSSFSSETRQMFAGGTVTTTASRYQASTTASSSMSLHPGATSAPPASPPPALPAKSRAPQAGPSHYDNLNLPRSKVCSPNTESSGGSFDDDWRPPLPPKKKHVEAYMRLFQANALGVTTAAASISGKQFHYKGSLHQSHQHMVFGSGLPSFPSFEMADEDLPPPLPPPALPPKRAPPPPPFIPPPAIVDSDRRHPPPLAASSPPLSSSSSSACPSMSPSLSLSPPASPVRSNASPTLLTETVGVLPAKEDSVVDESTETGHDDDEEEDAGMKSDEDIEWEYLELLDVAEHLVKKKMTEDGPEIRGGHVDVLIVHATVDLKNEYSYQEAFLTTYRTFVEPVCLIDKLTKRYDRFTRSGDTSRQRAAKATFSLLVRVVDDLAITDLSEDLVKKLMKFAQQLVSRGDLVHAKTLRSKILERYNARKNFFNPQSTLPSLGVSLRQYSLTDFKSEHLAEQMTLMDAELFLRIEIPEILLWVQEQNEDKSPNLTKFTEHFNNMSYWARTVILQAEPRDREKLVNKFIKIMRHLRKANNFNSYLALLSALDSAPIRRLEWQKNITEGLKEYCALIDSSASFRAYRLALQETQPPCIPYIGLVLQDLTFVHIGNPDAFPDGKINFGKRWQQFRCLDDMKRFKKCNYPFKKNEKILAFFNSFDDFLSEEALWQISETIKPRGAKKNANA